MRFATASDGTRLAYEEIGAGLPLLLVPGQSSDRSIWNGLREAFADRYRVVTSTTAAHHPPVGGTAWKPTGWFVRSASAIRCGAPAGASSQRLARAK
jgi:3',5'-cyclic AMP phosphodiesterase CpdA